MAKLSSTEKRTLETLLKLDYEHSLIFTYRTLHDFLDELGISLNDAFFQDIRNESQYDWRVPKEFMRDFIPNCFSGYDNEFVGKIILKLIKYIRHEIFLEELEKKDFPEKLMTDAKNIAHRLLGRRPIKYPPKTLGADNTVTDANRIKSSPTIKKSLSRLDNDKFLKLYVSLCSISLQEHPILAYVGTWSFFDSLATEMGRTDRMSFPKYFESEMSSWQKEKGKKNDIKTILNDIRNKGNCCKHSDNYQVSDALQLQYDFRVLEDFIVYCIEKLPKPSNV